MTETIYTNATHVWWWDTRDHTEPGPTAKADLPPGRYVENPPNDHPNVADEFRHLSFFYGPMDQETEEYITPDLEIQERIVVIDPIETDMRYSGRQV